jgi:hypothetical protein
MQVVDDLRQVIVSAYRLIHAATLSTWIFFIVRFNARYRATARGVVITLLTRLPRAAIVLTM